MSSTRLACPKCRIAVPDVFWEEVDVVRCPTCETHFEHVRFPALTAVPRVDTAADLEAGEANCYFHAQNRAEVACHGCGRYICAVCRVGVSGQAYCPSCLESRSDRSKLPENHRVLFGQLALMLAILPLVVWPFTLLTAPAAVVLCVIGWKKPGSLVGKRHKWRFIVAGLFALAQIGGWIYLFATWLLPK